MIHNLCRLWSIRTKQPLLTTWLEANTHLWVNSTISLQEGCQRETKSTFKPGHSKAHGWGLQQLPMVAGPGSLCLSHLSHLSGSGISLGPGQGLDTAPDIWALQWGQGQPRPGYHWGPGHCQCEGRWGRLSQAWSTLRSHMVQHCSKPYYDRLFFHSKKESTEDTITLIRKFHKI